MPELGEVFYPAEVIGLIADLYKRVKQLESGVRVQQRAEELDAAEPDFEEAPSSPAFPQHFYYVCRVETTNDAQALFLGRILTPTGAASKFIVSPTITILVTVDVPSNLTMPAATDVVGAFYAGNFGDSKPRFVLLGAAGGSTQCRVASEFGDYLAVTKISSGTTTGTIFNVAKAYALRKTPFDGQTLNGITRTYSVNLTRVASNSNFGQVEAIVPSYLLGTSLIHISGADHTDVFVSGSELKFIDLNVDGRVWASGE